MKRKRKGLNQTGRGLALLPAVPLFISLVGLGMSMGRMREGYDYVFGAWLFGTLSGLLFAIILVGLALMYLNRKSDLNGNSD